jgi:ribosomal protein S18 acetylase RimI-like enzyme
MVTIRPFEDGDNATMLDIEKLCPQGNEKNAMGIDKSPDAIARYKLYDNWKVLVAEEEGAVVGWIGWTVKRDPIQEEQYVYIAEVIVHPEYQRRGIATKLVTEAETDARETGSDYICCYIFEPNGVSQALFGRLGYSNMGEFKSCAISAYKKVNIAQKFEIERINKNDINDVVSLINDYYAGRAHFIPYTPESFESYVAGIPAYGLENFWVVKDGGSIVACAGLWDCSVLGDVCCTKVPLAWKVMRGVFGFLSLFAKMPKIPAEGEYFKTHHVTDHAFEPKSSDAMSNLIGYFNNILFDARRDFFLSFLDPNDPLFEIIKKFKPDIDTWYVFAKAIERELPEFSPFYVDIRDTIL